MCMISATYTLAFGPFTAAWHGPQRLVLTIADDMVTDVAYRAGYNERGCAERMPRLPLEHALHLVSRVCAISSHAHTMAFCQALETLLEWEPSPRVARLRCALAEIERLAAHLATLTTLFEALGQNTTRTRLQRLTETSRHAMHSLSGARLIPDQCVPGGLRHNPTDQQRSEALTRLAQLREHLRRLLDQVTNDSALSARTVDIGTLARPAVEQFGLRGPLARASGVAFDTRLDEPYAAYPQFEGTRVVEENGDVYARLIVLLLEAFESIRLVEQALNDLPDGPWEGSLPREVPAGRASSSVESPHGMLRYTLESDGRRLTAVAIDPPHQLDRLLARALLAGTRFENVMLIVLSLAPHMACTECS